MFRSIEARASLPQQIIKMTTTLTERYKYRENAPLDGTVQLGHSAVMQLCRVLKNRLSAKTFENMYF